MELILDFMQVQVNHKELSVFLRSFEHAQHPICDDKPAHHICCGANYRDEPQDCAHGVVMRSRSNDGANERYA